MSTTKTLTVSALSKVKYDELLQEEFTFIDIYEFIKDNIEESERGDITTVDLKLSEGTDHIHFIYFSADNLNNDKLNNLETINFISPVQVSSIFLYSKIKKINFTFSELINNSITVFELKHIIFDLYNIDIEIKKITNTIPKISGEKKEANDIGIIQMTKSTLKYEEVNEEEVSFYIFNYYEPIYHKYISGLTELTYNINCSHANVYHDYYMSFNFYMFLYDENKVKYKFIKISTANVLNISDNCYTGEDKIIKSKLTGACKNFYFSFYPKTMASYKGSEEQEKDDSRRLNIKFNDKYEIINVNIKDLKITESLRLELNQYILYKHLINIIGSDTKTLYHEPHGRLQSHNQDFNVIEYFINDDKTIYNNPHFRFSDQMVKIDFNTRTIEIKEPPPEDTEKKIDVFKSDKDFIIDIYDEEKNKTLFIPQFFDTYKETFKREDKDFNKGSYYEELITFTESNKPVDGSYRCEPKEYIENINIPESYKVSNEKITYGNYSMTYKDFYTQFKKFKKTVLDLYDELSKWKSLDNGEIDYKIKVSMNNSYLSYEVFNQLGTIDYNYNREYKVIKKYYIINRMKESRYLIDAFIYTLNLMAYNYLKVIEWGEILKTWDY